MLAILGCLFGIFVGIATAGYMFIHPLAERDKTIEEQKREIERKDEIVQKMKVVINDFMTKEDKLNKIKELADDYQSIN